MLGPNFNDERTIARLKAEAGMKVLGSCANLVDAIAAADLVMAEGGYNTVAEIRLAQVPAVFLPSARGLDDQLARVQPLADRSQALVFDDQASSSTVADTVRSLLATGGLDAMRSVAQTDHLELGNQRAGELLAELLR